MSELEQAISDSAANPKKASGDSGSVEMQSTKDQIESASILSNTKASKKGMKGILRQRAVPSGSV